MKWFIVLLLGCTDAEMARLTAYGNPGEVVCYSGGVEFYRGESTGKILTEEGSDGWYFNEKATNRLVRVSGACVVRDLGGIR